MIRNKRRGVGFTLIELLVALVVAGILAAIALPSYRDAVRRSKRVEGRNALLALMQQEERYFSRNTRFIPFSATSSDEDEKSFRWYSGSSPRSSAYEIHAEACEGERIQTCVVLTAMPGTQKVDSGFTDPACGPLTLDSRGAAGATSAECWK
ncbi:type IV pilin protein [Oxalobacteraceae bacterium OM1]|nr:type IV pilin protein [Oxalobacteraceae bacterium OM1]